MHFDLKMKSQTMTDFEGPLLIDLRHFHPNPLLTIKRPLLRLETVLFPGPTVARGFGGALKLPQQVRAEPGRQTFLVHLWPENEVWGALKLPHWVRSESFRRTCIDLKIKSFS